jgi:hypothetical protein
VLLLRAAGDLQREGALGLRDERELRAGDDGQIAGQFIGGKGQPLVGGDEGEVGNAVVGD